MAKNAETMTELRNQFYRNKNPRLLRLLWLMIIINFLLAIVFIYLVTHVPDAEYLASVDGKNTRLLSIEAPLVSQAALLQWASQATVSVYTYDFVNYPKSFADAKQYFTSAGWSQFENSNKKNVDNVIQKKLRVTAVATGAPVITDQGPLLNNYVWRVSIPILVTYESPTEKKPQSLLANMLIMRIDTRKYAKGIAIGQFNVTERPVQR